MHPFSIDSHTVAVQNLIALRKAAVCAHWIPGVGLHVVQLGRPVLRVTAWEEPGPHSITPCEFRRDVLALAAADAEGLGGCFDLSGGRRIGIRMVAAPDLPVELAPHGLVRFGIDGEHGAYGFVTTVEPDVALDTPLDMLLDAPLDAVPVAYDRDAELDVTLVHAPFPLTDPAFAARVFARVVDLAAACAADEVATAFGH